MWSKLGFKQYPQLDYGWIHVFSHVFTIPKLFLIYVFRTNCILYWLCFCILLVISTYNCFRLFNVLELLKFVLVLVLRPGLQQWVSRLLAVIFGSIYLLASSAFLPFFHLDKTAAICRRMYVWVCVFVLRVIYVVISYMSYCKNYQVCNKKYSTIYFNFTQLPDSLEQTKINSGNELERKKEREREREDEKRTTSRKLKTLMHLLLSIFEDLVFVIYKETNGCVKWI